VTRRSTKLALGLIGATLALAGLAATPASAMVGRAPTRPTACDLVTASDIESVTGVPMTLYQGGNGDTELCIYNNAPGNPYLTIQFLICCESVGTGAPGVDRRLQHRPDATPVTGVGDDASITSFVGGTERLEVISGSYGMTFNWDGSINLRRDPRQDLVALAKLAISRLSAASSAGGSSSSARSVAPAAPAGRSSLPGAFPDPTKVDTSAKALGVSALLTGLLMLMLAFPSELFNRTLKLHYRTVRGWLGPWARLDERVTERVGAWPQWQRFGTFMVIGGLLGALLDPSLGFDVGSVALVLGLVVSRAVITVVFALPEVLYMRRRHQLRGQVQALPAALAVAAVCVVLSRLAGFQPGYLYGVIVGISFARELSRAERGQVAAWAAGCVLVVSLGAWFAWIPVVDAINGGDTSFPILFIDAVLATIFVIGVQTVVIGLLPLRVLDGEALKAWSRRIWGSLYGCGLFLFVWVLLHPVSDFVGTTHEGGQVGRAMVPFLVFGAISIGFWLYLRNRPPSPLEPEPLAPAATGQPD
jgi:hypothetical protein